MQLQSQTDVDDLQAVGCLQTKDQLLWQVMPLEIRLTLHTIANGQMYPYNFLIFLLNWNTGRYCKRDALFPGVAIDMEGLVNLCSLTKAPGDDLAACCRIQVVGILLHHDFAFIEEQSAVIRFTVSVARCVG